MKPLTLDRVPEIIQRNNSILVVNEPYLHLKTFAQWLMFGTHNVSTKTRGVTLPVELWANILEYAVADLDDLPRYLQYMYVQGVNVEHYPIRSDGNVENAGDTIGKGPSDGVAEDKEGMQLGLSFLRCRPVWIRNDIHPMEFNCFDQVLRYQAFFMKPNERLFGSSLANLVVERNPPYHREHGLRVLLRGGEPYEKLFPILKKPVLFYNVDVADIISLFEPEGCCDLCEDHRFIPPEYYGTLLEKFDAVIGDGVELACPLCMGLEFSWDMKGFLKRYYVTEPPKEESDRMKDKMKNRLKELGYLTEQTKATAWRGTW